MTKRKPIGRLGMEIGGAILMGMPGISVPGEWHIGRVLWFDGERVLVAQWPIGGAGAPFPCLHDISYIRAIGTVEELVSIQHRAREAVDPLQKAVAEAESALNDARSAVWRKLDEFAEAEPMRNMGEGI